VIVVDTNVLLHLLLEGEKTAVAERVLARDPEWAAPLLARSEVRNALATWMRRGVLSLDAALLAVRNAEVRMRGLLYAVPSREVLELADHSGCTAYDCEFVALARLLGTRLVTGDRQVLSAFPDEAVTPEAFVAH
jgi:predicted nucleic acid-binding protein